jgi:hypothetical protein
MQDYKTKGGKDLWLIPPVGSLAPPTTFPVMDVNDPCVCLQHGTVRP